MDRRTLSWSVDLRARALSVRKARGARLARPTGAMTHVVRLAATLFVLTAGCSDPSAETQDESSDDAIVGGAPTLTDHPAVGFLAQPGGPRHCTGTLIAPNVVMSAAHCWSGPSELVFGVGAYSANAKTYRPKPSGNALAPYAFVHPKFDGNSHDLAYVVLEKPVTEVQPARIGDYRTLDKCGVEAVGYGRTVVGANDVKDGFTDERKLATICLGGLDPATGFLNATGQSGSTCVGDSGGGLLARGAAGDLLVAVVRGGDRCEVGAPIRFQPLAGEEAFVNQALAAARGKGASR